jgi:hypothetical protein
VVACIPIAAGAGRGVPDPKASSKQCEACPCLPNECIVSSCWGGGDPRSVMMLRRTGTCAGTGMQGETAWRTIMEMEEQGHSRSYG